MKIIVTSALNTESVNLLASLEIINGNNEMIKIEHD